MPSVEELSSFMDQANKIIEAQKNISNHIKHISTFSKLENQLLKDATERYKKHIEPRLDIINFNKDALQSVQDTLTKTNFDTLTFQGSLANIDFDALNGSLSTINYANNIFDRLGLNQTFHENLDYIKEVTQGINFDEIFSLASSFRNNFSNFDFIFDYELDESDELYDEVNQNSIFNGEFSEDEKELFCILVFFIFEALWYLHPKEFDDDVINSVTAFLSIAPIIIYYAMRKNDS